MYMPGKRMELPKRRSGSDQYGGEKIASALQTSALVDFAFFLYIKLWGKLSLSARNPHLMARSVNSLAQ